MSKYLDAKLSEPLPFFSASYVVENNAMQHTWSSLTELVPNGEGICLDMGAGDGKHRCATESKGWLWIGLDPSHNARLSLVGSAYEIPFQTESIDLVFVNQVLEHLTHPLQALSEVFRVLRPAGFLIGSVSFLEPWHESCYGFSHWGIQQILSDSGFDLVKIRPGTSVFVVLASHLLPETRLGPIIGGLFGRFIMEFLKWVGGIYTFLRFGKKSGKWLQYQSFLEKAPLRFAGHIQFVAKKPKH